MIGFIAIKKRFLSLFGSKRLSNDLHSAIVLFNKGRDSYVHLKKIRTSPSS